MSDKQKFTFEISLSVLNHLGRNLYRSFVTVLGEAISNSWDADADNVWITIDKENNCFTIKDDGDGMTEEDFQSKFLKIGYSKRKEGISESVNGRPFIGRKGIGKLALLSCAETISIMTKTNSTEYVGGTIDNTGLDEAITEDLKPQDYSLDPLDKEIFKPFTKDHKKGTIIHFSNIKEGIKNRIEYLKKTVALYFRYSLIDNSFNININGELITLDHLKDFAEKTQFGWNINNLSDPYLDEKLTKLKESVKLLELDFPINGFIASVEKPRNLKILKSDEKIGIDLFVNGRLREKDILKHISTARVTESYLYGQIHYNILDNEIDRFTSSREGIISDDPMFKEMLEIIKEKIMVVILKDWDFWRRKHKKPGDSEDESIPNKQRKAEELYNAVSGDYDLDEDEVNKAKVEGWVNELSDDAAFNIQSYTECFISENLVRNYIHEKNLPITAPAQTEITTWKRREIQRKIEGNINIDIRNNNDDLSFLDLSFLSNIAEVTRGQNTLHQDSKEFKPIRNAVMHTALLHIDAKTKLTSVYNNIKGRIRTLLNT